MPSTPTLTGCRPSPRRAGPSAIGPSAGSTSRPAPTRRWASGRCRPTRRWRSARPSAEARAEGRPGGPLAARRDLAQLPGPVPRDQRYPQADARDERPGRGDARRADPRASPVDHLFAGQSNDCYWHGLFGGIYLPDLRVAALARLIAAEDLADGPRRTVSRPAATSTSTAATRSLLVRTPARSSTVKLEEGGGIGALGPARRAATRSPRSSAVGPEAYHETPAPARAREGRSRREPDTPMPRHRRRRRGRAASIHDIVRVKQEGLLEHLQYDAYERRSGLVRILPADTTAGGRGIGCRRGARRSPRRRLDAGWARCRPRGPPPCRTRPFGWRLRSDRGNEDDRDRRRAARSDSDGRRRDRPSRRCGQPADRCARAASSGRRCSSAAAHNPAAWHDIAGRRIAHDEPPGPPHVDDLAAGNDQLGVDGRHDDGSAGRGAGSRRSRRSRTRRAGFELVYQGSATLLVEPLRLAPGQRQTIRVGQRVAVAPSGSRSTGRRRRCGAASAGLPVEVESGRR